MQGSLLSQAHETRTSIFSRQVFWRRLPLMHVVRIGGCSSRRPVELKHAFEGVIRE